MGASDSFTDLSASRASLTVWSARTYILYIGARGCKNLFGKLRVLPGKRRGIFGKTEHVVNDENLAIALRASADADRRNFQRCGYASGKIRRNGLENNGKCAGVFGNLR